MKMARPLLATVVATMLSLGPASADWYPHDCAAIDFCDAVEGMGWVDSKNGVPARLVVVSSHGLATVQRIFPVHESRDGRMHVCMRYDPFGDLEVTCLLIPVRGF